MSPRSSLVRRWVQTLAPPKHIADLGRHRLVVTDVTTEITLSDSSVKPAVSGYLDGDTSQVRGPFRCLGSYVGNVPQVGDQVLLFRQGTDLVVLDRFDVGGTPTPPMNLSAIWAGFQGESSVGLVTWTGGAVAAVPCDPFLRIIGDAVYAYVVSSSDTIDVFEFQTASQVATLHTGAGASYPCRAAGKLYVPNISAGTVSIFLVPTWGPARTKTVGGSPTWAAASPDGNKVYIADAGGSISIIDTNTDRVIGSIGVAAGTIVFVSNTKAYYFGAGGLGVIDATTNTDLGYILTGTIAFGTAMTVSLPLGTLFVAGQDPSTTNWIWAIDTDTDSITASISGHTAYDLVVTWDATTLIAAGHAELAGYDTTSLVLTEGISVPTSPPFYVAVDPSFL